MRLEYEIVQHLLLDREFRARFLKDRAIALGEYYPEFEDEGDLFGRYATKAGLEEEAYRRIAEVSRTSRSVFPRAHQMVVAAYGDAVFEQVLKGMHDDYQRDERGHAVLEILEPFDGYLVAPRIIRSLEGAVDADAAWLRPVLLYEWGIWQAARVVQGWPALFDSNPLSQGTTLVAADFDLKKLLATAKRLELSSVSSEVWRQRARPPSGDYFGAIYPRGGRVVEVSLDAKTFRAFENAIGTGASRLPEETCATAEEIGLVQEASFLCCPRDEQSDGRVGEMVSAQVEPQPH
jgi:hypothetical protein